MDYLITYGIAILLLVLCIWWNWDVVKLNSHSLHLQWLFWIAVIFPILSCVYFGSIIWYEYPLEVSKNGYNSFLEISKLPLYLLAGSPILGAFVASAHRSYQTDIQIKTAIEQLDEAQKKNKVDLYFTIKKNIIDQLDSLVNKYSNEKNNSYLIYKRFYTQSNHYEISLNQNNIDAIETKINIVNSYLKTFSYQFEELTSEGAIQMNSENIKDLYSFNDSVKSVIEHFGFVVDEDKLFMDDISEFEKIYNLESDDADVKEVSDDKNSDISSSYVKLMMTIFPELSSIVLFMKEVLAIIFPDEDASDVISNLYYLAHPE